MSSPAPSDPRRAGLALGAAGACAAVWLALPDATFVFDGVMFSGFVERSVEEWRSELFNTRHFLFVPAFQLLRDALAALGIGTGAYRLFQTVNALLGAAGLLLFADFLRRLLRDDAVAGAGAFLLAATWTYGTRATEGQVYMALAFGGVAVLWACAFLLEAPSPRRALLLAAVSALAVLFHGAALFAAPAAAAALWAAFPSRRVLAPAFAALSAGFVAVPYLLVFAGRGAGDFVARATDYHGASLLGLLAKYWSNGNMTFAQRWGVVAEETARGFAVLPPGTGAKLLGAALVAASAWSARRAWPSLDAGRRALVAGAGAAWAAFAVLNAFWMGGLFFQPVPAACLLALLLLAVPPRPGARAALAAGALALGAWNLARGLVPQSDPANNAGLRLAHFVRDHTVPSSWIIITGLGLPNAKIYLPHFAGRTREVLEYYFDRRPKPQALALLRNFVDAQSAAGVPVYVLSDLVEDADTAARMKALWGVDLGEIHTAFGPGAPLPVARGEVGVWLFVRADRRPQLFAGLAYSALTESETPRLAETANALKSLAAAMTPAERRAASRLLRESNWGFDLIMRGFSPVMGEASRRAAEERRARFAEFQKTPDFWLRAGNLHKYLGLKAETVEFWSKARSLSGDEALARQIEAYRRSP